MVQFRKRRFTIKEGEEEFQEIEGKPQDTANGEAVVIGDNGAIINDHHSDSSSWKGLKISDLKLLTTTQTDAQYLLIIGVKFEDKESSAELKILMHGPKGYLSAHEYPLLNFYMVKTQNNSAENIVLHWNIYA